MRINKYRVELDEHKHNVLIKENSCNYPLERINNTSEVVTMLNDVYKLNKLAEEHVYMVALNTKGKVLGVFEVAHGTEKISFCNTREIYIRALLCGASFIVMAHNHPSGDCTPSKNDIETHIRIEEAGKFIGIDLMDNIIIGDGFYSINESV